MGKIQNWLNRELSDPSSPAVPPASVPVAVPELSEGERSLAWVLRTLGEESFDLETGNPQEQRRGWAAWAGKVEARSGEWSGLRAFVGRQREQECNFVTRNVQGLRGTLWDLLQRLGRSVSQDAASDGSMTQQLQRLQVVVQEKPVEEIRREVLSAVETMGNLIHERQERTRRDLEESVRQLGSVRQDLSKSVKSMAQDPLTRIYNKASFEEQFQALTALGNLTGAPCTLVLVAIDSLKGLRGQVGKAGFDEVLRKLADALIRAYPRRTDFVARRGDAEFAALLPDTPVSDAQASGQRAVDEAAALQIPLNGDTVKLTVSIGAATLRRGETPRQWMERAAQACKAAQAEGGGRAQVA